MELFLPPQLSSGKDPDQIRELLARFEKEKAVSRFWSKDPSLWKRDPETQLKIADRLGWLTIAETMKRQIPALKEFRETVLKSGYQDLVILGMGGSSLCPDVFRKIFGIAPGCPQFHLLDTTNPATILRIEKELHPEKTLFIVASKSGTTIEVDSLYLHFLEKAEKLGRERPGKHFVAITDPGTPLENLAREKEFLNIFINPPDIGGRYSALSYFGLVPASLIGIDLEVLLDRAIKMANSCRSERILERNPGVYLGAVLASLSAKGRNKVTFIIPPLVQSFGIWIEQLLAESTGKEGKGLLPVEGEEIGKPECYGEDRLFVQYRIGSDPDPEREHQIDLLRKSGQPAITIEIQDRYDLAGEFFRWEMATAIAGIGIGINPFDEPNVKESKENTQNLLEIYKKSGHLPDLKVILKENGAALYSNQEFEEQGSLAETFNRFLKKIPAAHYIAFMAYLDSTALNENLLQKLRVLIRDRFRLATTVGYGPRFLHSTGQLHKGGKREGAFIQITADYAKDIPIPGKPYSFGVLNRSQSLGDLDSLKKRGLPILQLHLGASPEEGLKYIISEMEQILK
jgi:glucose-6-phosphate isomerase